MHLKGLDLNLLVVLDALLKEKSITRAGQKVYLSQSATSGALSRLRDFFGDQLLVPAGQKMVLTPFAETLVNPVKDILRTAEGMIGRTAAFDPATSTRSFLINMSDITGTVFLANSLPRIRQHAPNLCLEIITRHAIPDIIEQGDVDFMEVPDMFASPLHPSELLFEDPYVCIAASANKLVRKGLTLQQFLSIGHVVVRAMRRKEHIADMLLEHTDLRPRVELIVPVFGMVPHAVVQSDLIAMVNRRLAQYYARHLPLKIFPVPIEIPPLKMLLQWNKYRDNDTGIQWMRRMLVETMRTDTD